MRSTVRPYRLVSLARDTSTWRVPHLRVGDLERSLTSLQPTPLTLYMLLPLTFTLLDHTKRPSELSQIRM